MSSTNNIARRLIDRVPWEGAVVLAREQTAGRGRLGRTWMSPPGGLWLSALLRPPTPYDGRLSLALAAPVARAMRRFSGVDVRIKWPNDLIVGLRKVGGVLIEALPPWTVVGVGVNVNVDAQALNVEAGLRPTSLSEEGGRVLSLEDALRSLLTELDESYRTIIAGDMDSALAAWRELDVTLGRSVRRVIGSEIVEGEAVGIDVDGALVVRDRGGNTRRILAGDVELMEAGDEQSTGESVEAGDIQFPAKSVERRVP